MKTMTRREVLRLAGGATAIIPLAMLTTHQAVATDMPQVDPEDATAKALGYVHASENAEQLCNNCQLYTGEAEAEWGQCTIFPGKSVNAQGWCKSWVKKMA